MIITNNGTIKEERSAGVILYRIDKNDNNCDKRLYLILRYAGGHWDFAKGKKENGESDLQTALREVREETGITDVSVHDGFQREIKYEFVEGTGAMVHKSVIFFLGRAQTKDVALSNEHQDYAWYEYDDASFTVTYPSARGVLARADAHLNDNIQSL